MLVYRPMVLTFWDKRDDDGKFNWAEVELEDGDIVVDMARVNAPLRWGWEYRILRLVEEVPQ